MHNFSINIKRTDRKKTVSFQVERGLVKVLVPKHLDKKKLDKIIKSKSNWIKNKLSNVEKLYGKHAAFFVNSALWRQGAGRRARRRPNLRQGR